MAIGQDLPQLVGLQVVDLEEVPHGRGLDAGQDAAQDGDGLVDVVVADVERRREPQRRWGSMALITSPASSAPA